MQFDRRRLLQFGIAGSALAVISPLLLARAPGDRRFIFIIQRGALDGLQAVPATGDPQFAAARGVLGEVPKLRPLDATFGLHPALAQIGGLYAAREALFVHAIASPYRDRSHFDGQNVLESGGVEPYRLSEGWMNRLVGLLSGKSAIAFASTLPLALQGRQTVSSFEPKPAGRPDEALMAEVGALYQDDALLHPLWEEALDARRLAAQIDQGAPLRSPAERTARIAAGFLAQPDGPRLAMIETNGWDTHTQQLGRLAAQFSELDLLVAGLKAGLGPVWKETLVIAATEFGRTVSINGTGGTDHGTGSVAMLFGGALHGGRVVADWPGLAPAQRLDGRDLRPTASLDAMLSGALGEHFGVDPDRVATSLFPDGPSGAPMRGLVTA